MYQSPLNTSLNNKMITLMITYILSGRGFTAFDMLRAQIDGRILSVDKFIDKCCEIGFHNSRFIDKLMTLDYGYFMTTFNTIDKDLVTGYHTMFGPNEVNLDKFIKDTLLDVQTTLRKKQNWFLRRVRFKMHRQKNTLTVYDFMKVYTKPKSNNLCVDDFRRFYNTMLE